MKRLLLLRVLGNSLKLNLPGPMAVSHYLSIIARLYLSAIRSFS